VKSGPGEKQSQSKKIKIKSRMVSSKKKKNYDEPHLALDEKTQPIQWTEWPTGALVVAGSF
jgi:hypothetical protein